MDVSTPGDILDAVLFDLGPGASACAGTGDGSGAGGLLAPDDAEAACAGGVAGAGAADGVDDAARAGTASDRSCSDKASDADLLCGAASTLALAARSCIISDSIRALQAEL